MLASLMLMCSLPFSVLADGVQGLVDGIAALADDGSLPVVSVSSERFYAKENTSDYRAVPDDSGTFYLTISLNKAPTTDEEIVVYYRTVDYTAIAKWGDYESVGTNGEAYVTLKKSNGYKARISINSIILDYGYMGPTAKNDASDVTSNMLWGRKFYFELTRVVGNAELHQPSGDKERNGSYMECYLRADIYCFLEIDGTMPGSNKLGRADYITTTPIKTGKVSGNIDVSFTQPWQAYVESGQYKLGVSIFGECHEKKWNSDGPANFTLYYTYQGVKRKAFTFYMEGEWDDSVFYGWEMAYDYNEDWYQNNPPKGVDVEDYMVDNFVGFTIYDNDEKVVCEVKLTDRDGGGEAGNAAIEKAFDALKKAKLEGYVIEGGIDTQYIGAFRSKYDVAQSTSYCSLLHYITLPSNFVKAESYSYEFYTETDEDPRWLENVSVYFALLCDGTPEILKLENGNQMVTTNIDELQEGDKLRLTMRLSRDALVYSVGSDYGSNYITAMLNGQYPVTLNLVTKNMSLDTLVYEGELPEEAKNVKLQSLQSIKLYQTKYAIIESAIGGNDMVETTISNLYGFNRDLRTPTVLLNENSIQSWVKSRTLDVYLNAAGTSARYDAYATVYYQWSNSKELPERYSSSLVFHTAADGEFMKNLIGTGNGEMYLHIKVISGYGKEAIVDCLTGTYDPNDKTAKYTPFGPFRFDNAAPEFSMNKVVLSGTLMARTLSFLMPDDQGGSGLKTMSLYYIPKGNTDGEGTLLKTFTPDNFDSQTKLTQYTITHTEVGVGVDLLGEFILERRDVEFYWVLTDNLGNTTGKTARFTLAFDTNNYLETEILDAGAYNFSSDTTYAQFESATEELDTLNFIYNYSLNHKKNANVDSETSKTVYYGFFFEIDPEPFGASDEGEYSVKVHYKGKELSAEDYTTTPVYIEEDGVYAVWFYCKMDSGRYDIQLTRKEGESTRSSRVYSVYATNAHDDMTETRRKVEGGTLLNNSVYQLSSQYPYFYYKDADGTRQQEYYNETRQPATFSSYAKAKEYVYFKELSDIYLFQLNASTANALISGTTGYLVAKGETVTPQAGQYWIRYKSESWTPTSGDSSWVYYYYGMSGELYESAFSLNLQSALNAVSARIASYGSSVILTDTSLFLGSASGDKKLDEYGMPYLVEGQVHNEDEASAVTKCGNIWSVSVYYAGDRNIYKNNVGASAQENGYHVVGNVPLPEDAIFQYAAFDASGVTWRTQEIPKGKSFIDVFKTSGIYLIREISKDGVAIYMIYIDKEAPIVHFYNKDENGNLQKIPVDGVEIVEVRTKDLIIGKIDSAEYDRLSYVAVYKVSNLALVGIYNAEQLDTASVKLEDGNYYLVVADRSGNHYTITAKVSSSDLDCTIKETKDKFFRLTCSRRSDQILRYEVYLNGTLVTSTYSTDQSFDKAGIYDIYVQDIYGNVFSEEYVFTRSYPTVTWKYIGEDGRYHLYDPEETQSDDGFVLTWVSDNNYKISTSAKIRFSFSENYEFEFIGSTPEYTKTVGTETVVTIAQGHSFTLKVFYKNHSDCYTLYSCVVDITAPTINVSSETDELENGEYSLFDWWTATGKVGDVIELDELYYSFSDVGRRVISNGGTVSSDIIKINVSDANDLMYVEVYLDGELAQRQDAQSGFSEIVVGKWGKYRVKAMDSLGNIAEFNFTNGALDNLDYFVDGVERELALHGYLNFKVIDGKHVYTKVDYGNTEFKLDIKQDADIFISVGISDGKTEINGFRIFDGCIYPLTYTIILDNGKKTVDLDIGDAIIDMNAQDFKAKKEYVLAGTGLYTVYASINADKIVTVKVYAPTDSDKIASINARIEFVSGNTFFVSSEISQKSSDISFKDLEGEEIVGTGSSTDIRSNDGFTIDEALFERERVSEVSLYYSKVNDLGVDSLQGKRNIYETGKNYTDEGFYLLIVQNRFGNEAVYEIAISRSFGVTVTVTFADGHKVYYSKDYDETLYSNNEISLDVLNDDITCIVTKNGEAYKDFIFNVDNGVTYLIFSKEGIFDVTLTDTYGNVINKKLEINKSAYAVTDDLLTGYNEKALKREEGYTNQKLSIDKAVYDRDGLYYLAIKYGDTLNVLFDAFSETPVSTEAQALTDIVGADGDGVYTVICRNRYGTVVTKDIHYRSTPTLKLERTTRANMTPEVYDLDYALQVGFWANNTLIFSTEAGTYEFTVNGNASDCPRTIVFENAGDYGSFEYEITYVDEYGFEYEFNAYLVRKNVTINLPMSVGGTEVDGVLTTKNDIFITFGEKMYGTYRRNNGEEVAYQSGDVLKKDGTYRFTVMDYAGNISSITIKKDTIVEFVFTDPNTGITVQNGSIVNASKVSFDSLNKDNAYIEKVILDGVVQKDFTGNKFAEDGKWEVLLSDKLGNKAYFTFYLIKRPQNGFAYTTPYEYHIKEMWYDAGDGVMVSYMDFINHSEYGSSFEFIENGRYVGVMTSVVTGITSTFEFTINTTAPAVSLVGCEVGETTINDVTITGYKIGERIKIYKATEMGEKLIEEVEITSLATKIPTITEGGKYRIVVESEAGVVTELSFVRKHVMNTAGSVFIMIIIGISVVGLFTGLVYRNKSKTDD